MTPQSLLKFCACCPAPCRSAVPRSVKLRGETETPSSLSLIALAVVAGDLPLDDTVRRALSDTLAAEHCVAACRYGHDVLHVIEGLLGEHGFDLSTSKSAQHRRG